MHGVAQNGLTEERVDGLNEEERIDGSRLLLHGLWPEWGDVSGNRTGTNPLNNSTMYNLYWPQYCADFASCCTPAAGGRCHDSSDAKCKIPNGTVCPVSIGRGEGGPELIGCKFSWAWRFLF
jgi:hypothetical protein